MGTRAALTTLQGYRGAGPARRHGGSFTKALLPTSREGGERGCLIREPEPRPRVCYASIVHRAESSWRETTNVRRRLRFLVCSHFLLPQLVVFHLRLSGLLVFVPRGLRTPLFCRQQTSPEPPHHHPAP